MLYLDSLILDFWIDVDRHLLPTIIEKYEPTHEMVLCGDMNGTLMNDRNNAHDCNLKNFVKENKLLHSDALSTEPTFFQHNRKSTSQIDYILSTGSFMKVVI
jgi:endonuclease/exonuclease/phosphatase family metal-dependent hydrolase